MSVRSEAVAPLAPVTMEAAINAAVGSEAGLAEGNAYSTANPDHPLTRNIAVTIRSTLSDLTLSSQKATWAPSTAALESIYRQRKFTDLSGSTAPSGDLKSVVLHNISLSSVKSTFPVGAPPPAARRCAALARPPHAPPPRACAALGTKITGVDDATFSSTGEAFSMVVMPGANSHSARTLQSDDVSMAYDFAKVRRRPPARRPSPVAHVRGRARGVLAEVPGLHGAALAPRARQEANARAPARSRLAFRAQAENISSKGVHEVSARNFVLVAAVCAPYLT